MCYVSQREDFAVLLWQRFKRSLQGILEFTSLKSLRGNFDPVLEIFRYILVSITCLLLLQRPVHVSPVLSKSDPSFIDRDLDQPCAEFRPPVKSADVAEVFQDRLLSNFFSVHRVPQNRFGYGEHRGQVWQYETPVSLSVSPAHLINYCRLVVLHAPPRSCCAHYLPSFACTSLSDNSLFDRFQVLVGFLKAGVDLVDGPEDSNVVGSDDDYVGLQRGIRCPITVGAQLSRAIGVICRAKVA